MGHDRSRRAAPRAGAARPAQGPRPVREPAPGPPARRRSTTPARCAREIIEGTDLLVVRELTGGIYFGEKTRTRRQRRATSAPTRVAEIERIARTAFGAARAQGHERRQGQRAGDQPRCGARSSRACTARSSRRRRSSTCSSTTPRCSSSSDPRDFDVILTENMFGDILSDEAAMITGSIGMLPSASLGDARHAGLFEPVHGSAPDIAGQGIANPLAMFLSAAMLLRHGLGLDAEAAGPRIGRGPGAAQTGCAPATSAATPRTAEATAGRPRPPAPRRAARGASGPHLDERRVRRLGGREGPRTHARPALRHRRLRGHPLLRHRDRPGGLPPPGPHRPPLQVGRAVLHADPVRRRSSSARRRSS